VARQRKAAVDAIAGKRVLVGVTGSIAAYKAGDLVRELGRRGAAVTVVMTASAKQLVGPETFRALTGREVYSELFPRAPERTLGEPFAPADQPIHIKLAAQADLIVVAPATASVIAKMTLGLADDLLTTLLLVARCPVVVAPAMNPYMLDHPTVRAHLATLAARGVHLIESDVGLLACGYEGEGKLAAVDVMVAGVERAAALLPPGPGTPLGAPVDTPRVDAPTRPLAGRRVLVTAGRTEEPIDPVRFLSNRSSGRMGFALAAEARDRGAAVVVVAGKTDLPPPLGVEIVRAVTAAAMAKATRARAAESDVILMCAAVSDWRPAAPARDKMKKRGKASMTLALAPTEDILAGLGAARPGGALLVGFSLETANALAEGRRKLREKGLDLVVINGATEAGSGPGAAANRVALVDRAGKVSALPLLPKPEVAARILDKVEALLVGSTGAAAGVPRPAKRPRARTRR
jgi:phosphopantothenoylcysteine decarboxylase/phosphopantothenate--cysteine ligase